MHHRSGGGDRATICVYAGEEQTSKWRAIWGPGGDTVYQANQGPRGAIRPGCGCWTGDVCHGAEAAAREKFGRGVKLNVSKIPCWVRVEVPVIDSISQRQT